MLPLLLILALPLFPADEPANPPNVIVVLMDDIGRDKIAAYGDHPLPAVTPHLDAFAQSGVLFRNAWTYPVCSPTRAALLTGRLGERTGIGVIIGAADGVTTPLPDAEVTLAEALPEHSSYTLGKWHLGDAGISVAHPLTQGFRHTSGYRGSPTYFSWESHTNGILRDERGYFPTMLTRRAKNLLSRVEPPFFLYHCPILAHSPFHVPPQDLHTQGMPLGRPERHRAMVEAFDRLFGDLMQSVDLSDTYVFVLGDNGSPNPTVQPPWPWQHGKRTPYEGGLRVPFLVAGPGVAAGAECDELIHVTDLFATVLELVGQPPAVAPVAQDSSSFAAQLSNPSAPGQRDTLYVRQFPFPGATSTVAEFRAIRTKRWKLIDFTDAGSLELYDLAVDPDERDNLLQTNPGPTTDAIKDRLLAAMPTFP